MTAQSQGWEAASITSVSGQHVHLLDDAEIPRTEIRRKRPYTHSVYVCNSCRKAHRKCIHSRQAESSSDDGESSTVIRNYQTNNRQVGVMHEPAYNGPSSSITQFFIEHVTPWFIGDDVRSMAEEQRLWQVEVPRLCHTEPFLCEAMTALSSSFDNCPRPRDFDPEEISSLTSNALKRVQRHLGNLISSGDAQSAPTVFLVICMLSSMTIHGPAPLSTLKMHMQGLAALCTRFGEHLVSPAAVTRNVILQGQESSRLVVLAQIPFKRRHIMFVDPLLRCIPSEEFHLNTAQQGSIFNLMLVANRAIRLWEHSFKHGNYDSEQGLAACSKGPLNRFFGAYCFNFATFRENLVMLGNKPFQNYVDLLRTIFEQTIFAVLKQSAQTAVLQKHKVVSLRQDLALLEANLDVATQKCSIVRLQWPAQVLADVRAWCDEQEQADRDVRPPPASRNRSSISCDSGYASNASVVRDPFSTVRHPDDLVPISELLSAKIELHDYTVDYTKPC